MKSNGGNAEKIDEHNEHNMIVTEKNAWMAYEEIFKMWQIDLTEVQKKRIKDVYFK